MEVDEVAFIYIIMGEAVITALRAEYGVNSKQRGSHVAAVFIRSDW